MTKKQPDVTVLGLGAMGRVLASTLLDAGYDTTLWNRTAGKADALTARGAVATANVRDAVTASPLVVACLLDHRSVHQTLDPVGDALVGRALVNLTTTTPNEAREMAEWCGRRDAAYLDGGIMAIPEMIGKPGAVILYSGAEQVFREYRPVLERWGESSLLGSDAGLASLWDLSLLAGMYVMFGGFFQGAAMIRSAGVPATAFAARLTPFLASMTAALPEFARIVDAKDYTGPGQQSLEFSALGRIVQTSLDAGVAPDILAPVQALIRKQIAAGHGKEGFARLFEGIRS